MVGLVCGEEQGLGARRDVVAVEHELADLLAERSAAGLPGDRDRAAGPFEGLAQQGHLGGLAGAVAALEDDERSAGHAMSLGHGADGPGCPPDRAGPPPGVGPDASHHPNVPFGRFKPLVI